MSEELFDTISFGGWRPTRDILGMLKRYGFKLQPDGINWQRPSKGHHAGECDIIMEAYSDYWEKRR